MEKKAISSITVKSVWQLLEQVKDPEIPVLSIIDLGIVRNVEIKEVPKVLITITPTYSGCPAMNVIEMEIKARLEEAGMTAQIITVLSPAWTTDWMTESGKEKLRKYGIAPPLENTVDKNVLFSETKEVPCPRCQSVQTKMISQFGSTACKALYKCLDCLEPFDYFKCH